MLNNKKMFGVIAKILCLALVLSFVFTGVALAEEREITVYLDGEKLEFDAQPKMVNDRVMVPMRLIFEKLGAEVLWDPLFARVIVNYDENDQLVMHIDEKITFRNGYEVTLDSPAFISEGRTYVPLRFVSESLNQAVEWDDSTYSVYIVPKHKGMQYIPFGEFLTIPCPYSINRNFKTLEYDNTTEVVKATYSLNGETATDFERYTIIMKAVGFENIKAATEDDARVIYYGKGMVVTLTLPGEDGIFTVELYSDDSGETVKEYLGGSENE